MSERNQMSKVTSNSGSKKTWALVIAGTAVLLLVAGVMLQVARPTAAYPEDGSAGRGPAGRGAAQDGRKTRNVARVGKQ